VEGEGTTFTIQMPKSVREK